MPKPKTYKSNSSKSKKSDNITVRSVEPVYSEEVDKWRYSKGNASYLDAFYDVIRLLNTEENRNSHPNGDGYDYRLKASHQHFTDKLAIFYEYIGTELHPLAVMKHFNDSNRWKRQ